jgi:murein DD-endopeptidase MepM/ murein hydrolase activator NlpD
VVFLLFAPGFGIDGDSSPEKEVVVRPARSGSIWDDQHPGRLKQAPPRPKPPFVWPVDGPISNFMTAKHPLGIDIGLAGSPSATIRASAAGRVVFAGGAACCGYGLHVIVEHGDLQVVYAHLSEIQAVEGQEVVQSQALGVSGSTGHSTGEHLHIEFRRGEELLDPAAFMPPACPIVDGYYPFNAVSDGDCKAIAVAKAQD